jgi:hypothetical protein
METVLLAVTLLSLAIAIGASSLAWRVMRDERLRSEARIAVLAADLGIEDDERPLHTSRRAEPAAAVEIRTADDPVVAPAGTLFAPKVRERSAWRFAAGVGVAALLVAAVIGTLVLTSRGTPHAPAEPAPAAAAPAPVPADVPLELLALGHEREADRLTVRGVVRGVAPAQRPLTAVVALFDREGTLIGSGRGMVQSGAEADPAGERTFVVTVNSAGNVGRYRISFRSDDHIVPHVDRRAQPATLSSNAGTVKSHV